MSPPKHLAQANRLIANLRVESTERFLDACELVNLNRHDVLTHASQLAAYAYFPIDSYIAISFHTENSSNIQVDLTGNEGMVNVSLALGVRVATLTSVVEGAGRAIRIHHNELQKLLNVDPSIRRVLNLYISLQMDQWARNMACASFHTVEQRLARCLLLVRDRAHSNKFLLTQKSLSEMLFVRRERVTQAASELKTKNLISYSRGDLRLINQPGLEAVACGCYEADVAYYEAAMDSLAPAHKPDETRRVALAKLNRHIQSTFKAYSPD